LSKKKETKELKNLERKIKNSNRGKEWIDETNEKQHKLHQKIASKSLSQT
jgi:hypothetical protein